MLFLVFIMDTEATLSKGDKKKRTKDKSVKSPIDEVVLEDTSLAAKDVLDGHSKYSTSTTGVRQFLGPVLGYVTPWNSHGYDVAKIFGPKFSLVSPVWLQVDTHILNWQIRDRVDYYSSVNRFSRVSRFSRVIRFSILSRFSH